MEEIIYERRGNTAHITINRPQAMNALGGLSKKKAAKLEKEWKKPRTVVEGEGV